MKKLLLLVFGVLFAYLAHAQPNITAAEYFFNSDPGPGNGISIPITAGTTIDIVNFDIPTTSLPLGWHTVHVRARDANNVWGFYESRKIYIREGPIIIPPDPIYQVSQMEYFYNTDNGVGTGTPITITQGDNIDVVNENLANSLPVGWHTVHVRTKNTNDVWGFYESRKIYIREGPIIIPPDPIYQVSKMEYFYNTDNGVGTGTPITITQGDNIDVVNENLANSLPIGWHTVHVRTKNTNDVWGFYESRKFYVREPPTPCCVPPSPIVELEYFVDADPGVGLSSTKVTINPSLLNIDLVDEPLNVGTQSLGAHKVYVRAKNQAGEWSMSEQANFSVIASCPILTAPSATGVARCDAGPVTLTASGAAGGETYRWYATASSLTPLFTGNPYTTASLSVNTTFYVTAFNPTTYCESARSPVSADISGIAKPALSISGTLSVCEGTTQVITAPSGFTTYTWSNALTTQQITVATSGSYSVVVNNGICSSPPSDAFVFTVNTKPPKPTITATNGGSLCGTGSVTLSAPTGLSSYAWSSGQTTETINVTTVGSFFVTVTNASGCQSVASDPFPVTSAALSKPTVTVTGNTALCNSSTVDLSAPSGFSSYAWSTGATTQSITVSTAGSYTVVVSNGGCTSPASDAIVVTTVAVPAKPSIVITGSTALCNGAFAVLSAPTGFSNYVWSNGELTRQIVVAIAGSFTVQTGNASNCLSVASDPTAITLTGAPCGGVTTPSITNASRCGSGTVILNASGATGSQIYRWYDAPTAGTLVFTGAAFTTPSLMSTTFYYVVIYDPSVTAESNRVIAIATVVNLAKPVTDVTGTVSICAGGNTAISAPSGFATYSWSNGATSQQVTVSASGSFSVQVGDGTCTSVSSDVVTVTSVVVPVKPAITITGNLALCNGAFVGLSAPNGFTSYLWSTGETTKQIVVSTAGSFSVQTGNASNCLSVSSDPVAVTLTGSNCTVSTASPTATGASRCGSGTVSLTASGASGSQVYRWYDLPSAGTMLFTGSPFTTPDLTTNTSFYVSIFDPTTGESNRVIANATLVNLSKPVTDVTGTIAICAGGSTLISAPAGFIQYKWSDGSDKQQLQVTAAGNYSVQTGDGTCLSASSDAVTVTIESPPSKPTITTTGSSTLCSGPVTLSAPGGLSYLWTRGETTQSITVAQAGSYSVSVTNTSGCGSVSSDPFVVTASIGKPAVSLVGSNTICDNQTTTLVGPIGFNSYKWSSGETTQQLIVTKSGSYTLTVTDAGGCTSVSSDAKIITVNVSPIQPIITTSGDISFCVGKQVTLKGPDGLSYTWSNGATTQAITVTETGSYSLVVKNLNGCASEVSASVLVTANVCSTNPPIIEDKPVRTSVNGRVTTPLAEFFSDKDNDVDLASIEILTQPSSGAKAFIDANNNLVLDYQGKLFAGDETISIKICDLAKNCTFGELVIRVAGDVVVYNAISPNGDGLNETLYLEYIDLLTETKKNRVRIFNRWGDVVYEAEDYNNTTIAFKGIGANGEALPPGTYFYRMDFTSGVPFKTGYFSLRR